MIVGVARVSLLETDAALESGGLMIEGTRGLGVDALNTGADAVCGTGRIGIRAASAAAFLLRPMMVVSSVLNRSRSASATSLGDAVKMKKWLLSSLTRASLSLTWGASCLLQKRAGKGDERESVA